LAFPLIATLSKAAVAKNLPNPARIAAPTRNDGLTRAKIARKVKPILGCPWDVMQD
jgi:hypothetical protein